MHTASPPFLSGSITIPTRPRQSEPWWLPGPRPAVYIAVDRPATFKFQIGLMMIVVLRTLRAVHTRAVFGCLALAISMTLVLSSCGGGSSGASGSLLFTTSDGITERKISSGSEKVLVSPPSKTIVLKDPAVSPDGGRIAYVYSLPLTVTNKKQDASYDIWIANRDGSDAKILFMHSRPNEQFAGPQWEDAGHLLVLMVDIDDRTTVAGSHYSLVRIDIATGGRAEVMKDIRSFGLSPDAKRIVFSRSPLGQPDQLYAANIDGSGEVLVAGTPHGLGPFTSPRFAPDGQTIAFAAAEASAASASHPRYVSVLPMAQRPGPDAHGSTQDIWIVDAAGAQPRLLAAIKEDDPRLVFSGDGTRIYVSGATALFEIEIKTGKPRQIQTGTIESYLAYAP